LGCAGERQSYMLIFDDDLRMRLGWFGVVWGGLGSLWVGSGWFALILVDFSWVGLVWFGWVWFWVVLETKGRAFRGGRLARVVWVASCARPKPEQVPIAFTIRP